MSSFATVTTACPCGASLEVLVVRGLHAGRSPDVRDAILARTLHRATCAACGQTHAIETGFVYTDLAAGHYVAVEPLTQVDVRAAAVEHEVVFRRTLLDGPPPAQAMARGLRCRLVLGLEALREKLLLWDAGLDDAAVEAAKGDVLFELGLAPAAVVARVDHVDAAQALHVGVVDRPPPGAAFVSAGGRQATFVIPAARWQARAADRGALVQAYPHLADPWLVDVGLR